MPLRFKQKGKEAILFLEGALTIDMAGEFKRLLLEIMSKVDRVTVKAMDVSEVDLACFQVLCSAHRLFDSKEKTFCLSPETADLFRQVAKRSCFSRTRACDLDLTTECLWEEG